MLQLGTSAPLVSRFAKAIPRVCETTSGLALREAKSSFFRRRASTAAMDSISYLSQAEAIAVDEQLMGPLGFSVDQLMELAGLSVACAVAQEYDKQKFGRVLVISGPGNNGGDGLVAARHLHHFGYDIKVVYPKPTKKPLFTGLVTQCQALGIAFLSIEQLQAKDLKSSCDVVIDAIFGFSFKGAPRPPFDAVLEMLKSGGQQVPIVSVDIPSGWQVQGGDDIRQCISPDMLVSLTAPKKCAKKFKGRHHYLGGRFVPPAIKEKYNLFLPEYPGQQQCVKVAGGDTGSAVPIVSSMRVYYENSGIEESEMNPDPMKEFEKWLNFAVSQGVCKEPNAMTLATAGADGMPSARIVLLKGFDERGFVFYTNYNSRKGKDLGTGSAALCFFWETLHKQVRVEGQVEKVSKEESEAYFHSRPRASQVGAWASAQSSVIAGRHELEERMAGLERQYADEDSVIPKPPNWGGFLVRPMSIEFWNGRPSRLHDRVRYVRQSTDGPWVMERLAP